MEGLGKGHLLYLSNRIEHEHGGCSVLHHLKISENAVSDPPKPGMLVDTVWSPPTPDAFPGLFVNALPDSPFLKIRVDNDADVSYLAMTTAWRSQMRL